MTDAFILDAVRTPRGRGKAGKGALSGVHPQELLAQTLNRLVERTGIDPADVDDVVVGCVSQVGEQGANIARNAVLAAGWPDEVTGVDRQPLLRLGPAGGQLRRHGRDVRRPGPGGGRRRREHVARAHGLRRRRPGRRQHARCASKVFQVPQGISADLIATLEGFSREDVDAFALESQRKAAVAQSTASAAASSR